MTDTINITATFQIPATAQIELPEGYSIADLEAVKNVHGSISATFKNGNETDEELFIADLGDVDWSQPEAVSVSNERLNNLGIKVRNKIASSDENISNISNKIVRNEIGSNITSLIKMVANSPVETVDLDLKELKSKADGIYRNISNFMHAANKEGWTLYDVEFIHEDGSRIDYLDDWSDLCRYENINPVGEFNSCLIVSDELAESLAENGEQVEKLTDETSIWVRYGKDNNIENDDVIKNIASDRIYKENKIDENNSHKPMNTGL